MPRKIRYFQTRNVTRDRQDWRGNPEMNNLILHRGIKFTKATNLICPEIESASVMQFLEPVLNFFAIKVCTM